MNCKPGDLAIRVRAFPDSFIPVGAVVLCISFDPTPMVLVPAWAGTSTQFGSTVNGVWDIEWNGKRGDFGIPFGIPDEHLRPIRETDGDDETLQWAPVPELEPAC